MLDSDLALLYEVTTGNFNKAVKRNAARFPKEFSFVLNREELAQRKRMTLFVRSKLDEFDAQSIGTMPATAW